jgi:Uma2 family endonuclease
MSSAGIVIDGEQAELIIPLEAAADLASFRRWALSDHCPDSGRIDFIAGRVEVGDMAGEELFAHGSVKAEIARVVANEVRARSLGYVFIDSTRIASPEANLSAEPDVVAVTYDTIESGLVRLVPKSTGEAGRYVEIEGPPDLVVEVVSDSTVRKDTRRLPQAYFAAGVTEFWLADGRKDLKFSVYRRGRSAFELVEADAEAFQPSQVLGKSFRLDRTRDRLGEWQYDLVSR